VTTSALAAQPAEPVTSPAVAHLKRGQEHYAAGSIEAAIAALQDGLEAAGGDSDLTADLYAEFGKLRLRTRKPQDAIPLFLQALALNPAHWASRAQLVEAMMATRQYPAAEALLQELLEERPQDSQLQHLLGQVCFELNQPEQAIRHFEQAIAQNPNDADSRYWIGGIRQQMGDIDAAAAAYAAGAQLRPLIRQRATITPPEFRLLAIYAPFSGNTPAEYLFKEACYDIEPLALFGPDQPNISALGDIDVVVNLISDADRAAAMLPAAAGLAAKLGKPVVNDPGKILHTTRDAAADLLRYIPACRVPRILRVSAGSDVSAAALAPLLPFGFPVLARPVGTHGGDDFEKIERVDELAHFLAQRPDADHYVIEYLDYVSSDGHFRKYRFIFVDEKILPYHLAIGSGWKVHHASTDMADRSWMQQEEAAFLANPAGVFNAAHDRALRIIRERIGLDYFGVDCALDSSGHLIVFEVNASMLVHDDNAEFPYKGPFVRAIKAAFDTLLRNRAGSNRRRPGSGGTRCRRPSSIFP
jgi:tetratricopeptide (TPR) repeat protein